MKKITPQGVSIVLFLLLWVAIILYIGAKRDLDNQREATQNIYGMLTPQQKIKLQARGARRTIIG